MKRAAAVIAVSVLGITGGTAGCGGSGNDPADEQAVRDLISRVNQATADRDPGAACDAIAPSSIREQFKTRARCVRETGAILKQAGEQPQVEVQSVEITGDRAAVTFKDRNGEVEVVREDGRWYIPIESGATGADTETVTPDDASGDPGGGE